MPDQECQRSVQGPRHVWALDGTVEAVATAFDREQFVLDACLAEPPGHQYRLLVGHVGVLITVQQEGRRVIPGDVPLRAIPREELRIRAGVDASDFARP